MVKEKIYLFDHSPHLKDEWDFEKNSGINPEKLTIGSNKKVWWTCSEGHTIQRDVYSTVLGRKCLYCIGQKGIIGENDLPTLYPELTKFLVNPSDAAGVLTQSNQYLDLVCSVGHKFPRRVHDLVNRGFSCPVCSGRRVLTGYNDLKTTHPIIADELYDRSLATKISYGSQRKLEWVCTVGHSYQSIVKNRTIQGQGCPFCSGRAVLKGFNDIATTHPVLVSELVNENDGFLYSKGSEKKLEWICSFGHKWKSSPSSRIVSDTRISGCPICFNKTSKAETILREECSKRFNLISLDHTYRIPVPFKKWKSMQVDIHFSYLNLDVILEYDGCYWHQKSSQNDMIKTKSLLDNGYTVIRLREQASHLNLPFLDMNHESLLQLEVEYSLDDSKIVEAMNSVELWLNNQKKNT